MEEIIPATTITLTDNNDKIRLRRRIKNMCVHQYILSGYQSVYIDQHVNVLVVIRTEMNKEEEIEMQGKGID